MSVRIEQTAERAHRLVATGEVAAAQAMLREALATVEPDPAHASPSLATAAMLYARVLVTLGEPGTARRWAAYAHTASRRLFGAGDERTLQAASVLAGVLYRAGAYSRSAYIYRDLINQLSAGDGPRSARVLAAQADLATVLHARGDCAHARDLLAKTWTIYRYRYGEDHPVGIRMLARLGGMERNCGLPERARERFALAEALCRWHLPPGHRLTAQIGILSRTPPDRRHICTEPHGWAGDGAELSTSPPMQRSGPVAPAGRSQIPLSGTEAERVPNAAAQSHAAAQPHAAPEPLAGPGHGGESRPQRPAAGRSTATAVAPRPVPPVPATLREADELNRRVRRRQQVKLGVMAGMAVMIVTVITIAAGVLIARARSTSDDRPDTPTAAPSNAAPGDATPDTGASGNAAPGNTATPTAAPQTGQPAASRTADPVPPPAAQAPGPPTGVKLSDSAGSLTLTWVYPAGASGQVVLSAGRPGQPRRTFQTLPAGTSQFTVYGLAQDTDYCFGVAVAYSPTVVKTAPPVCTAR